MIWPMSIIMKALTSNDDKEIKYCIQTYKRHMVERALYMNPFIKMIQRNLLEVGLLGQIPCLVNYYGRRY